MDERSLSQQTAALVARDLGLDLADKTLSEQELFDLVANEVAYMIEHRLESLMSLLYRLDVREDKISLALSPHSPEPANLAIARLIIDRQKMRIHTKQVYKQSPLEDLDEGLQY